MARKPIQSKRTSEKSQERRPKGDEPRQRLETRDSKDSKSRKPRKPALKNAGEPKREILVSEIHESGKNGEPGENGRGEVAERIAKRMARAGLCSRRDAERWIAEGRVKINGKVLLTPAFTVTLKDRIEVDDQLIGGRERTRLWLYNKPQGLVTTNRDPEGRRTVFESLPDELPRVMSVGRLDINTEGLLLLTNDGGLARMLELPSTGWLRRYRVRVHGKVEQRMLDGLKDGIAVEGVLYGSIEAILDQQQGSNAWLTVSFREGKNREVKKVLGSLGLEVTRLIRISYGPFQLGDLDTGGVREIRGRALREQLGEKLIERSGADFDAPVINQTANRVEVEKRELRKIKRLSGRKTARGQVSEEVISRLQTRKPASNPKGGKPLERKFRHADGAKGTLNKASRTGAKKGNGGGSGNKSRGR